MTVTVMTWTQIRHHWRWCFHRVGWEFHHPPQGMKWIICIGPFEIRQYHDCTCT